jgi:hypothetical protein
MSGTRFSGGQRRDRHNERGDLLVSRRRDEVQESMDTVVSKAWVSLDPRLLGKNVVVLALEVADNLLKAVLTDVLSRKSGHLHGAT